MNKFTSKLAAAFFGFCLTTAAFAIEVPLKYNRHPDEQRSFYPFGRAQLKKKIERPTGKWKIPELISEYPIYTFLEIGDKERLCILDRQKASDVFYNRLYFDANGNSDLTDDPIIDGILDLSSNQRCTVDFPFVDTTIETDGKSLPYSFRPYVYTTRLNQLSKKGYIKQNLSSVYFYIRVNCSYSGEFQVSGQNYNVVLGDSNCNGRFNDMLTLWKPGRLPRGYRSMRISAHGDHLFITSGKKIDSFDQQVLGDLLLVKDKLFRVSISTSKGTLTLTPITNNLVALKLPMKAERISLHTEDEKHCLNVYQPGKEIMVPPGKYRLISYEALRKDEQGDLWRLSAAGTTESPFFAVDGSSESVLEFGEPYTPIPNVTAAAGRIASSIYLIFNVEGRGKEFITDISHISGNQTRIPLSKKRGRENYPIEPTYKIMNASSEVVSRGSFEYG